MAYALVWMRQCLLDRGLRVAEADDWRERGRAEMGTVRGVMVHHTAGPRSGNMPSLDTLMHGRSDLPGPLAHLGLGRDGSFYLVAAGRANHAGAGDWRGITSGNTSFIGIEVENVGTAADLPWPVKQRDALVHGCAALLQHIGVGSEWLVGHKEYALPKGRKPDPLIDMDALRRDVAAALAQARIFEPVPIEEPPGVGQGRPTLERDSSGEVVRHLQRALGLVADGQFGPRTEAAVREWQRDHGLVADGIFGPRSWARLDALTA
ncbi:N-acetylmuramoyl-L-alanine amidase [Paucibacter sp. O1-1]|nr:N-acetylmuramoyl-L-alanine amidase [Paucibacter sp. O1-1]MDA3831193.1 N-acetylmuramoyl-L-alanine amidase [Paucibacter sp. O1-1]